MDPFLLYLIAINVAAFLAFAIDFWLCMRNPSLEDKAANALILDAFPVAGGAVGTLLALYLLTGKIGRHRMNKYNIAWWFLAIFCLVVWALFSAVRLGFVRMDVSVGNMSSGWNMNILRILVIYLPVINVVTFAAFVWDKHVAANGNNHQKRVPEACLLGLSLIGGSVGGLLAMRIVHHKTKRWYFVWGLPCIIVLNVVTILYVHMCGLI